MPFVTVRRSSVYRSIAMVVHTPLFALRQISVNLSNALARAPFDRRPSTVDRRPSTVDPSTVDRRLSDFDRRPSTTDQALPLAD